MARTRRILPCVVAGTLLASMLGYSAASSSGEVVTRVGHGGEEGSAYILDPDNPKNLTDALTVAGDLYSRESREAIEQRYNVDVITLTRAKTSRQNQNAGPKRISPEVEMFKPVIIHKKRGKKRDRWYVFAKWNWPWKSWLRYIDDDCHTGCWAGGLDGFGIRFHGRKKYNKGVRMRSCANHDDRLYCNAEDFRPRIARNRPRGVAMTMQDAVFFDKHYTADTGSMRIRLRRPIHCGTKMAFVAHYFHTWESTDINGIGISRDGFSVNWSSRSHHWRVESQMRTWKRRC